MAWISIENLGLYHQKLKDWINKLKINASNIIQDDDNKLVTNIQVESWNNKLDADANAVSASKLVKPVKINNVPFDGSADINIYAKAEISIQSFEIKLSSNQQTIELDDTYEINEKSKLLLFVDGIKLTKDKHYTIDLLTKSITLKQPYEDITDISILIF